MTCNFPITYGPKTAFLRSVKLYRSLNCFSNCISLCTGILDMTGESCWLLFNHLFLTHICEADDIVIFRKTMFNWPFYQNWMLSYIHSPFTPCAWRISQVFCRICVNHPWKKRKRIQSTRLTFPCQKLIFCRKKCHFEGKRLLLNLLLKTENFLNGTEWCYNFQHMVHCCFQVLCEWFLWSIVDVFKFYVNDFFTALCPSTYEIN